MKKQIAVIDCAIKQSSIHCFNRLIQYLDRPLSYHRPPVDGMNSLHASLDNDQGYIIFGSASNVEDQLQWQKDLAEFCHERLIENKPVFGICFGHQLMANYFGATIARNEGEVTRKGSRDVTIINSYGSFQKGSEYNIFSAHSFEVKDLPDTMIHVATSEECFYDALAHKSLPYMGLQGHPEASPFFVNLEIKESLPDFNDEEVAAYEDGPYFLSQFFEKL